jgi:integrase
MDSREIAKVNVTDAVDIPLRPALIGAARAYMDAARAESTRRAYQHRWEAFKTWCTKEGRQPLPASPETIAAWMAAAASGSDTQRPWARSTINQGLSSILLVHHAARYPFDRKHPIIAETWRGISRTKARTESPRQAQPIRIADLRKLLDELGSTVCKLAGDARDAALLALGWSAALRRSELIGLDWEKVGAGTGYLRIDERGMMVTLTRSKGAQTEAAMVVVPSLDMPSACSAVKVWASIAALQPGEPVFRPIDKRQRIGTCRLTDRSVSRIIKARVHAIHVAAGKTEAEAHAIAAQMSGHSMRSGYATAAAAANVPSYRIQQHTRHKSAEMVSRYVREADKWTKSGLKGVGF